MDWILSLSYEKAQNETLENLIGIYFEEMVKDGAQSDDRM